MHLSKVLGVKGSKRSRLMNDSGEPIHFLQKNTDTIEHLYLWLDKRLSIQERSVSLRHSLQPAIDRKTFKTSPMLTNKIFAIDYLQAEVKYKSRRCNQQFLANNESASPTNVAMLDGRVNSLVKFKFVGRHATLVTEL
jgi:hypothetical protein